MNRIYYCNAEKFPDILEKGLLLLTEERREKAEGLIKPKDKDLSVLAGLMLKNVLGVKEDGTIKYGEHGKPYFEHGEKFSLAHSGKYAVLAVSDCEIGVDIEDRQFFSEHITQRFFKLDEQEYCGKDLARSLRVWTLKEAALKLTGSGFSYPAKKFSVLPFEGEHEIDGTKMKFFLADICGAPLSAAYCGGGDFTVTELFPEDIFK